LGKGGGGAGGAGSDRTKGPYNERAGKGSKHPGRVEKGGSRKRIGGLTDRCKK